MGILHENPCIKHDLVTFDLVVENPQRIVNLLRKSLKKEYFSILAHTQIDRFWRNVSDNIQTAFFDCLHMVCC